MKRSLFLSLLLSSVMTLHAGNLTKVLESVGWMKKKSDKQNSLFLTTGTVEDKRRQLDLRRDEHKRLKNEYKDSQDSIDNEIEKIEKQIVQVEDRLKTSTSEDDQIFLKKQRAILRENKQVLLDLKSSFKENLVYLEAQIGVLDEHLKDPEFKAMSVGDKSFYSFEHLQDINQKISNSEQKIIRLEENQASLSSELETVKQSGENYRDLYNDKEQLREELSEQHHTAQSEDGFDLKQQGELVDVGIKLLKNRLRVVESKTEELTRKKVLLDVKLSIEKARKKFLEEQRFLVRRGLRVEDTDSKSARMALETKKQEYVAVRESYLHEKSKLSIEREQLKETFERLASEKLGISISDSVDLGDITFEPKTAKELVALNNIIELKEHIVLIDKKRELLDLHIVLADVRFEREQVLTKIVDSWYKVTLRMFRSDEDVEQDLRDYQKATNRVDRELAATFEKRAALTAALNSHGKDTEIIKGRIADLEEHPPKFMHKQKSDYERALDYLKIAKRFSSKNVEASGKLLELYSSIIAARKEILRNLSTIMGELKSLRLRPANAISWAGVKQIVPDLLAFKVNIVKYGMNFVRSFTITAMASQIKGISLFFLFVLLLRILLIALAYFFLRSLLPRLGQYAQDVPHEERFFFYAGRVAVLIINFFMRNINSVFIWLLAYFLIHTGTIQDVFMRSLFYLISIPYLIMLVKRLMAYVVVFDREQEYLFFSEELHQKIRRIVSIVLYATIVIFFFREAFILMTYGKSELPTMLLALYSIIVRLVLISLVTKEDILEIVPTTHYIWNWIRGQVEQNYYPIYIALVALIILSEPHIGYGNYISYILWGTIGTVILIRLLVFLHVYIRDTSSRLFFSRDGEVLRERFSYSKSAYGIFTIVTFISLGIFFVLLEAKVLGYTMTLTDLYQKLQFELFKVVGASPTGEPIHRKITILSLLQVLSFIFSSFIISYAFGRFVLKRTFSLLMVEPGVQHTLLTLSHYLIVLLITLLGFQRVGLGYMILWSVVAPLFFGLIWSVKDYANDFVSYFIILVQRPFKIGDFVKIDGATLGVIRKITPRSVIVRQKNSVTVLIPNSKIISGEIHNWNYTRGFSAFDDVMVSVPYSADPERVRTIIFRVMDENIDILKNPHPIVRLTEYGSEGFVFMVRAFHSTDNVPNRYDIASTVRLSIAKALQDANIQIIAPARLVKRTKA